MGPGLGIAGRLRRPPPNNPGPCKAGRTPGSPITPSVSQTPETTPTSQAPSQPQGGSGGFSGSRSQASRATRGEGEKLPNRRRRARGAERGGEALGRRQASQPPHAASPEALRQVAQEATTLVRSQPGAGVGGVVPGHRDEGAWRCSAPRNPRTNLEGRDTGRVGRERRDDVAEHGGASQAAGRTGFTVSQGVGARGRWAGEARSCLPTPVLQDTPSHCRPLQKATNPTAVSPALSLRKRRTAYRRLPSLLPVAHGGAGIYLKGVGHFVYAWGRRAWAVRGHPHQRKLGRAGVGAQACSGRWRGTWISKPHPDRPSSWRRPRMGCNRE